LRVAGGGAALLGAEEATELREGSFDATGAEVSFFGGAFGGIGTRFSSTKRKEITETFLPENWSYNQYVDNKEKN
jgi:hypothetical protein